MIWWTQFIQQIWHFKFQVNLLHLIFISELEFLYVLCGLMTNIFDQLKRNSDELKFFGTYVDVGAFCLRCSFIPERLSIKQQRFSKHKIEFHKSQSIYQRWMHWARFLDDYLLSRKIILALHNKEPTSIARIVCHIS